MPDNLAPLLFLFQEAVDKYHSTPDLSVVLMDMQLPRLSGMEATKIIREAQARACICACHKPALTRSPALGSPLSLSLRTGVFASSSLLRSSPTPSLSHRRLSPSPSLSSFSSVNPSPLRRSSLLTSLGGMAVCVSSPVTLQSPLLVAKTDACVHVPPCEQCVRSHVPVLFLTAQIMPEVIQATMANGADGYLTKPITRAELLSTVHQFCVGKRPVAQVSG